MDFKPDPGARSFFIKNVISRNLFGYGDTVKPFPVDQFFLAEVIGNSFKISKSGIKQAPVFCTYMVYFAFFIFEFFYSFIENFETDDNLLLIAGEN